MRLARHSIEWTYPFQLKEELVAALMRSLLKQYEAPKGLTRDN